MTKHRRDRRRREARASSLDLLLSLSFAFIVLCLLGLTASSLGPFWNAYTAARSNLGETARLRATFDAANRVSAERGPANSLMTSSEENIVSARWRIVAARDETDRALGELVVAMRQPETGDAERRELTKLMDAARQALLYGRNQIDRVADMPGQHRPDAEIKRAIAQMFAAFDAIREISIRQIGVLGRRNPALASVATVASGASDLREYAGRLGSIIVPAIARNERLSPLELEQVARMQGRLHQLWDLLRGQSEFNGGGPLEAVAAKVEAVYFGTGQSLIASMVVGGSLGSYPMSVGDLTRLYVPTMMPLEELREAYLANMANLLERDEEAAFRRLCAAGAAAIVVLACLAALFAWLRLRVLRPLLQARRIALALASGEDSPDFGARPRMLELVRLFEALAVLRHRLRERAVTMAELQKQAETDGLTGVWNRRALERFALVLPAGEEAARFCLVIADIDHFKSINDTFGHQAGDDVLRSVARRLADSLGSKGVIARLGGEEFAVLLPGGNVGDALRTAEEMRAALRSAPVPLGQAGGEVAVRASFGVAAGLLGSSGWPRLLGAADRALYRAKANGRDCVRLDGGDMEEMPSAA
ncbi:GGDEF domain-containing protein [Aureimonas psammosilenae]|uniref:GGDEF domain-containing protein n=1 Tax=Aureimonas psammosilenae TaxID=2495496 RepID=UPI001260EE66|nr:GGDEF domain-containing protein [Aureimonas psammosilenae]